MTHPRSSRLVRLLRAPALHFAVAGALCFGLQARFAPDAASGPASAVSQEIRVDATRIHGLRRDFRLANQHVPDAQETRALVDDFVTEEILFREGLAMGFEQEDRAVEWRVSQKMRYLGEGKGDADDATLARQGMEMGLHLSDPVVRRILVDKVKVVVGKAAGQAGEQELQAWYRDHSAEYEQAGRVTIRHVFFDRGRRGSDGARQAAEAALEAARGHGLDAAGSLGGDPFLAGPHLAGQGRAQLTKFFGAMFAQEILDAPAGRWSGPWQSAYGWHVVWIEERMDPRVPALDEVRGRVEKALAAERAAARVQAYLAQVRPRYHVWIDEAAMKGGFDD